MASLYNLAVANPSRRKRNDDLTLSESLRKMRVSTFIFVCLEIVILVTAVVLYAYDIPAGFKAFMKEEYWLMAFSFFIILDLLVLFLSQARIASLRNKTDLESARILGSDIQEAYNFGQIGLVITNDDGMVVWDNSLFKSRAIDLLDKNIFDWQPSLNELVNAGADATAQIEFESRHYDVKYLPEARLFIFKDDTEFENLHSYSKSQSLVIGMIVLDNYGEIAGNADDDNNDIVSKVRTVIFDYCKDNGVLLRRFKSDSYLAICNFDSLEKMQDDSFSILEKARAIGKGANVIPTLSICFAHGFGDVNKHYESAANGVDIAMSRGGDQAVVSIFGEDLRFFGGRTAAIENTGRVQFRSVADSIIGILKTASNVYVMGHTDMDMDALGGCLGMKAICEHYGKQCEIIYDARSAEKKTKFAFANAFNKAEFDDLIISPKEAINSIKPSTLLVVVDVSVPEMTMAPDVLEKAAKTIVIDHHRRGEQFIEKPVLTYVDTTASSTSEIFAEFIHYATANPRIDIKPVYATLMLSGIFLDTTFFKNKSTGIRSFEAAEILKEFGADNQKADNYLKDEYEEYALVTKIVSTLRTPYTGIVYCLADDKDIIERSTLAKVANQLMALKGINACFVIGKTSEKETRISCRSDGTVNVQLLAEKLGGGGHYTMAAAGFVGSSVSVVEDRLIDTLETYLSEARADTGGKLE